MTDDPQTRYRRSGFGGSVRRGRRPAVVVVDCTRGFTDPNAAIGSDMSNELDVIARLIHEARRAGAPVLFTAIAFPENVPNVWLDKAPGLAMLREAFDKTMLDPDFLAEAEKLQLDINPLDGQGLADFVKELLGYDQAVIDHANTLTAE